MNFVPVYILILACTILIDYVAGRLIERAADNKRKKLFLILSIIANVGLLMVFKYINFTILNFNALASALHWNYSIEILKIALPIGLSFHTFQSLSYTIEVYRGKVQAEKNLGIFALFVMFYPQLVAGPIERPQNLLHQFREKHQFEYHRVVSGLKLMAWGFVKKMVLADRLAEYVDLVYGNVHAYQGWPLIIATVCFAFQIYYDFSGYCDIARGAARVMGFELMVNFNNPYRAKTIGEFWRRWHISLTTWFKDYVYIPLGGNRVKKARVYMNMFIVFLLSGLWHGASWTFVIWGALNGCYLIISDLTIRLRRSINAVVGIVIKDWMRVVGTFTLVCVMWVFFRAHTIDDAVYVLEHMFTGFDMITNLSNLSYISQHIFIGRGIYNALIVFVGVFAMETLALYAEKRQVSIEQIADHKKWQYRWALYYAMLVVLALFSVIGERSFIYFQF